MKVAALVAEVREQADDELGRRAERLAHELFKFRLQRQTNQVANSMSPRHARRELARVKTILRARQLGIEGQGGVPHPVRKDVRAALPAAAGQVASPVEAAGRPPMPKRARAAKAVAAQPKARASAPGKVKAKAKAATGKAAKPKAARRPRRKAEED